MNEDKQKIILLAISIALFILITVGLAWLSQQTAVVEDPNFLFIVLLAFTAGMSMIVLPCTLPLVFVIIPMCAGKGFLMALLFGLGLTITITIYGIILASIGSYFGLSRGSLILFLLVGGLAYVFGLSELKIVNLRFPHGAMPRFIQEGSDYWKSFGTGLVLGNVGIACPNPLFYVLLIYIAALPDPFTGGFVALLHGLGRATPLVFMAILAVLGVETTRFVVERRIKIERLTGYALIVFGAFILVAWLFQTPGIWILETPPKLEAWGIFILLSISPWIISKYFIKGEKHAKKSKIF